MANEQLVRVKVNGRDRQAAVEPRLLLVHLHPRESAAITLTTGSAVVGCFELFRMMKLVPQCFRDQADQRICNGIHR
jgi:hypothetical protein